MITDIALTMNSESIRLNVEFYSGITRKNHIYHPSESSLERLYRYFGDHKRDFTVGVYPYSKRLTVRYFRYYPKG